MNTSQSLSRFHGAIIVRMSPELLNWLTRYSPKRGETRKLRCAKVDGEPYFDESELQDFDAYLKAPWPCEEGGRPNIPTGIEREIEIESCYSCAICGKSTRESAHIDPVHSSKNNHPHNLICLCPTHHTEFDTGVIAKGDIAALKKRLISARLTLWKLQARGFECAVSAISEVEGIKNLPKEINELLTAETLEALGKAAANAPVSEFSKEVAIAVTKTEPVQSLKVARTHELKRKGDVDCPLCLGSGNHNGWDCPVCEGRGAISLHRADKIDLTPFEQVECPLCDGSKRHDGEECPVCEGYGEIDRLHAENVDLADYAKIECPLCDGSKRHDGEECPVCEGYGEIDRRHAENVDLADYAKVECPLCDGSKRHDGEECPVCEGYGEIDRRHAENVDLADYAKAECPLCNGSKRHDGEECPVCEGYGEIDRRHAENVDLANYAKVECPLCEGSKRHDGGECPVCEGYGEIDRMHAENVDLANYAKVECPLCDGSKRLDGDECPVCEGYGKIDRMHAENLDLDAFQ
jgi:DnaJ-class molecular chaperone